MLFLTFLNDFQCLNIPNDVCSRTFSIIKLMMTKNELHYHSFKHIESIFDFIEKNNIQTTTLERMVLYFHDVVYSPKSKYNEEYSSEFCRSILGPYLSEDKIHWITDGILTTKLHLVKNNNKIYNLILDLDISGFANPYEIYSLNTQLLEKEFYFVENFKEKRKDFLIQLLNKGPIYRSNQFEKFEQIAQNNIKKDIETL